MKNLVIVGAGTGGTVVANRMHRVLPDDWSMVVVDPEVDHLYQPGLLFLPFGAENEDKMIRPRAKTFHAGIQWLGAAVDAIDPDHRTVQLASGVVLPYDLLVIATGTRVRPDMLEGLTDAGHWGPREHTFYTLEGAQRLRAALETFEGGKLVVNIAEMPIKCPVAPLEFIFLADDFFTKKGIRDKVELTYATPLEGCFTRPVAARTLSHILGEKGIHTAAEFAVGSVDPRRQVIRSWDVREVPYDLLVSIPTHSGAEVIGHSGLGDDMGFVPTDPHTLVAKDHEHIFVLGDATDLPSSKAGSVAHFQSEVLAENLLHAMRHESLAPGFDGHANCFVETGHKRGLLIDFNYDVEPLPGRYPVPGIGPFALLHESRMNHLGKLGFRWLYWHGLLPGRPMPVPVQMSMKGKHRPVEATA